jgi:hypothetical protein
MAAKRSGRSGGKAARKSGGGAAARKSGSGGGGAAARKGGGARRAEETRIARQLDALYAQLPHLECKGKCAHSCTLIEMGHEERRRIRRETGVEIAHAEQLAAQGCTSCPALEDGRCRVHPVRPMICRLWGIDETMPCPHGCVPEGGWISRFEGHSFLLRSYVIAGWPPGHRPKTAKELAEHLRDPAVKRRLQEVAREERQKLALAAQEPSRRGLLGRLRRG